MTLNGRGRHGGETEQGKNTSIHAVRECRGYSAETSQGEEENSKNTVSVAVSNLSTSPLSPEPSQANIEAGPSRFEQ